MGFCLWDPHHVVDIPLVRRADSILLRDVLGGVIVANESPRTPLSLITHITVEKLVTVNLQKMCTREDSFVK